MCLYGSHSNHYDRGGQQRGIRTPAQVGSRQAFALVSVNCYMKETTVDIASVEAAITVEEAVRQATDNVAESV